MLRIYWFRKDLRLFDNTALSRFCADTDPNDRIAFIYIKNRNTFEYFGEKRIVFLSESLNELSRSLNDLGYELQILGGRSVDVFEGLADEYGAIELYFNKQVEPYCINRDERVTGVVEKAGGRVHSFDDTTLLKPGSVTNLEGAQYKVYTPFRNQFARQVTTEDYNERKVKPEKGLSQIRFNETANDLTKVETPNSFFRGGRTAGLNRLKEFYGAGMDEYKSRRDFPGINGTSGLSPHLHFGTVSIREAYRAALKKLGSVKAESETTEVNTWINELLWREFYYHITHSNPKITYSSFREEYDNVKWNDNEDHFEAWCRGMTGYPIVDAGMRQLKEEGWMHNRVRMITAMFLTKDLLIDWRLGEKYFAEHLIDLDLSSNNGGWQWSASTGVDAQPYFRIFNPYLQSRKFDPGGDYIRRFVKELRAVPAEHIHEPDKMTEEMQREYDVTIGVDYPLPIVDHMKAKEEVLKRFGMATGKIQNQQ